MKRFVNPFTIAFAFGVVFLTVLPIMQGRFLKAPPPIGPLGEWSLQRIDGATALSSAQLKGHVLMATLVPDQCDASCAERVAALSRALEHTDDLGQAIQLVVFVRPGAVEQFKGRSKPRFEVVTGDATAMDPLLNRVRAAWFSFAGTDAGTTPEQLAALPAFIVVDQNGDIRGFWRDDSAGRGNAVNGARLLAKRGPNP